MPHTGQLHTRLRANHVDNLFNQYHHKLHPESCLWVQLFLFQMIYCFLSVSALILPAERSTCQPLPHLHRQPCLKNRHPLWAFLRRPPSQHHLHPRGNRRGDGWSYSGHAGSRWPGLAVEQPAGSEAGIWRFKLKWITNSSRERWMEGQNEEIEREREIRWCRAFTILSFALLLKQWNRSRKRSFLLYCIILYWLLSKEKCRGGHIAEKWPLLSVFLRYRHYTQKSTSLIMLTLIADIEDNHVTCLKWKCVIFGKTSITK